MWFEGQNLSKPHLLDYPTLFKTIRNLFAETSSEFVQLFCKIGLLGNSVGMGSEAARRAWMGLHNVHLSLIWYCFFISMLTERIELFLLSWAFAISSVSDCLSHFYGGLTLLLTTVMTFGELGTEPELLVCKASFNFLPVQSGDHSLGLFSLLWASSGVNCYRTTCWIILTSAVVFIARQVKGRVSS